jgi:hypothetical protein
VFYAMFFVISCQFITMFGDARRVGRALRHLLG